MQIESRQYRFRKKHPPMSEINVTPMVDVMLVLLIIFMVTSPLMTVGIAVDLPKAKAVSINDNTEPVTITINKEGAIFLQENAVSLELLIPKLQAITQANPEALIFFRGDKQLHYGRIMEVMGSVNSAGFRRLSLLAELPNPSVSKS
jgi:biopolymer transport protein TolR